MIIVILLRPSVCRHIKDQVKEAYLDTAAMDDGQLLMQFFKKRDIDNNMKLDGLELLYALVDLERKYFCHVDLSMFKISSSISL